MQAIPLFFGDTIRHLRFTFAAVEDIDQLMPDGFMSVFEREADVRICHLLLWAGFRHESVPYEGVGLHLAQHPDITPLWRAITYALINDEWLALERKDDPESKERKTLPELIAAMEKIAASDFNMLPQDFYALTPREFNLLQESYGMRANLRTGLVCATMANIHARRQGRAYEPKDFIRCGQPEHRQSVKEQSAVLSGMFGGGS